MMPHMPLIRNCELNPGSGTPPFLKSVGSSFHQFRWLWVKTLVPFSSHQNRQWWICIPSKMGNLLESLVLHGFDPSHPLKRLENPRFWPFFDHPQLTCAQLIQPSPWNSNVIASLSSRRKVSILHRSNFGSGRAMGFAGATSWRHQGLGPTISAMEHDGQVLH
jgi:hypothetical protein